MHHFLFSAPTGDGRTICVAQISRDTYEANQAQILGDDTGYFIYEFDPTHTAGGIEILAKTLSYEAAVRLTEALVPQAAHTA